MNGEMQLGPKILCRNPNIVVMVMLSSPIEYVSFRFIDADTPIIFFRKIFVFSNYL